MDKQKEAKALMADIITLERTYSLSLTQVEFATALRLYADEVMKIAMTSSEIKPHGHIDRFLEL